MDRSMQDGILDNGRLLSATGISVLSNSPLGSWHNGLSPRLQVGKPQQWVTISSALRLAGLGYSACLTGNLLNRGMFLQSFANIGGQL